VWNVKTSIGGTLQGTEDTASSGGGFASNIQESTEGTLVLIDFVNVVGTLSYLGLDDISINLVVALIDIVEANLLKKTPGTQESSTVGGGVVFKTNLQSRPRQLVGTGTGQNTIAIDQSVGNLANNLLVGETNDKAVLGRLVLVLGLAA
jgi:hypothetical protein